MVLSTYSEYFVSALLVKSLCISRYRALVSVRIQIKPKIWNADFKSRQGYFHKKK